MIVVILIFALAVWIAPDRRRAIRACAIGLIVAGLVLIFIRRVVGNQLIDKVVADDSVRPAAHRIWWIATDQLGLRDRVDRLRGSDRPARRLDRRTRCPCHRAP